MEQIYGVMDVLFPFEWAEFSFMKNAFLAVLLITPLFGLVGTMVVNNRMSFFSDALGHSALTGIAIGVLLGVDNYLLSMLGFALLFALGISAVIGSGVSSADTIIGVFSSTGLALGVVLLVQPFTAAMVLARFIGASVILEGLENLAAQPIFQRRLDEHYGD